MIDNDCESHYSTENYVSGTYICHIYNKIVTNY